MSSADEISARKREHLLVAQGDAQARRPAGWADVELVHVALPELDFDEISTETEFLGRRLAAPLAIASMTGGHPDAERINARLARAAERAGIVMALGSQRAMLHDPSLARSYTIAREEAPGAFLVANLGVAQLVGQGGEPPLGVDDVRRVVELVRADALALHLNFLEEVVQPEGDRCARGCLEAIARVAETLDVPVIAKETGAGLSRRVAELLRDAGVAALDVGGRGGTSFAAIEGERAAARGDVARARLGELFRDWGVPTPAAVTACAASGLPVIATGGVRSGLDAAKALALGASVVGLARPFLEAAVRGDEAVLERVEQLELELRTAMFLTGSATVADLRSAERVVLGPTAAWLESAAA
jgi:isopentenyl-diphosphate delta-isomerase